MTIMSSHGERLNSYMRRIERIIIVFRFSILFALVLTAYLLDILKWNGVTLAVASLCLTAFVGGISGVNRWRHWSILLVIPTIEILLLQLYLYSSAKALGLPLDIALSSPGAWLVFIYLVIGVLRLQAGLVAYSGLLFAVAWWLLTLIAPDTRHEVDIAHAAGHLAQAGRISDAVRLGIIVIATGALAFATWHSRRSLLRAIQEGAARKHLSTHFPRAILGRLIDGRGSEPSLSHGNAAVIFVDVCGFTAMAEAATGNEVGAFLSHFRSRVHDVVSRYDGVVDKFIGDGVLIVFGVPDSQPDDAARALSCVIDLRDELAEWRDGQHSSSIAAVNFGIGLHFGEVLSGVIGNSERVEFTVLGDTVNVAARLQQLANDAGGGTVVSEDTLLAAGLEIRDYGKGIITVPLKGRRESVRAVGLGDRSIEVFQGTAA